MIHGRQLRLQWRRSERRVFIVRTDLFFLSLVYSVHFVFF
jgi:hypothetical protein